MSPLSTPPQQTCIEIALSLETLFTPMHAIQYSSIRSSVFKLCIILCLLIVGFMPAPSTANASTAATATSIADATQYSGIDERLSAQHVTRLVDQADLIVRGHVSNIESIWRAEDRQIETVSTIQIGYTILGPQKKSIQVRTAGGFLPERGIGMVSLHAASFAPNEEVLLFLAKNQQHGTRVEARNALTKGVDQFDSSQWQVVHGAAGKFVVRGQAAINHDGLVIEALDQLLANITTVANHRNRIGSVPFFLQYTTTRAHQQFVPMPGFAVNSAGKFAGKEGKRKWATPHAGVTYHINLNSRHVNEQVMGKRSSDFRNAIIGAANRWSNVKSADFTLRYGGVATATTTGYNGISEILFMHKGPKERAAAAEVWYTADLTVVEADIWINDDYLWDASGEPAANAVDLESALAHEFGHWLILGHLAEPQSIMYPQLSAGRIKRGLHAEDIAGISAIYPR